MMKRLFPLLLLIGTNLWAQEARKVWTLRELIDYAVSSNLTVKRGAYGVRGGEVNYLQSKIDRKSVV